MALGDQLNRQYGFDTSMFTIKNLSGTALIRDCIGIFSSLEYQIDYELVENRAVKDAWVFQKTRIASWRAPVSVAVTNTSAAVAVDPGGYDFVMLSGSRIRALAANATSGMIGYKGDGLLVNFRHPMGEGGQVISFDLVGQGALTVSNAAPVDP